MPYLTLATATRFSYFARMLQRVSDIPGDVVECGVGWGRSLLQWALLVQLEEKGRRLWGFDSFEGFPEPGLEDRSCRNVQKGEWKTDRESVLAMLKQAGFGDEFFRDRLAVVPGFFADSLKQYTGVQIAILHIDADLYQSYVDVLTQLYGRVAPGGVVLFDEYRGPRDIEKFPGASKAVDEFFAGRESVLRDQASGKHYAIKRPA